MNTNEKMEKLEMTERSWETNAPDAVIYDLTLDQYRTKIKASRDIRVLVAAAEQHLQSLKNQRDATDEENLKLEQNIAKAIAGDPKFGDNSDLYEGTGRVRKSERKSGLTRKNKNKTNGDGEDKN